MHWLFSLGSYWCNLAGGPGAMKGQWIRRRTGSGFFFLRLPRSWLNAVGIIRVALSAGARTHYWIGGVHCRHCVFFCCSPRSQDPSTQSCCQPPFLCPHSTTAHPLQERLLPPSYSPLPPSPSRFFLSPVSILLHNSSYLV